MTLNDQNAYTPCLKKLCQLIFCFVLVKYESISVKIGRHVPEETTNKTVQKVTTSPITCVSTTLKNLKWQIKLSTQYLHVHSNESSNSYKTTGSYCLKNRHTCSKSHCLYIVCSKWLSPVRMQARRRWRHDINRMFNERVIQTVHSFLMRRLSSSTCEILVRAGGGHFEHVV